MFQFEANQIVLTRTRLQIRGQKHPGIFVPKILYCLHVKALWSVRKHSGMQGKKLFWEQQERIKIGQRYVDLLRVGLKAHSSQTGNSWRIANERHRLFRNSCTNLLQIAIIVSGVHWAERYTVAWAPTDHGQKWPVHSFSRSVCWETSKSRPIFCLSPY